MARKYLDEAGLGEVWRRAKELIDAKPGHGTYPIPIECDALMEKVTSADFDVAAAIAAFDAGDLVFAAVKAGGSQRTVIPMNASMADGTMVSFSSTAGSSMILIQSDGTTAGSSIVVRYVARSLRLDGASLSLLDAEKNPLSAVTLPEATSTAAGLMPARDKARLDATGDSALATLGDVSEAAAWRDLDPADSFETISNLTTVICRTDGRLVSMDVYLEKSFVDKYGEVFAVTGTNLTTSDALGAVMPKNDLFFAGIGEDGGLVGFHISPSDGEISVWPSASVVKDAVVGHVVYPCRNA